MNDQLAADDGRFASFLLMLLLSLGQEKQETCLDATSNQGCRAVEHASRAHVERNVWLPIKPLV